MPTSSTSPAALIIRPNGWPRLNINVMQIPWFGRARRADTRITDYYVSEIAQWLRRLLNAQLKC